MATYPAGSGPMATSRPPRAKGRRRQDLVVLAAGAAVTGAVLGVAAATPPSDSSPGGSEPPSLRTYAVVEAQNGTVTALSPTSITVGGTDGSSRSYLLNAGTGVCTRNGITAFEVGDPVVVTATVTGGQATATDITDAGAGAPAVSRTPLPAVSPLAAALRSCPVQFAGPPSP